jgi:predicted ester cyclase
MTTEGNKAVVRRFFDVVVSHGNLAVADELCSPTYRVHATLSGPDAIGVDQMKELVTSFRSSFPDARITIEDIVAEGDLVAARLKEDGTHAGAFQGIQPTGRRVAYGSMTFLRIVHGKIVDHWGLLDMPSLLQQIGGTPSTGAQPNDRRRPPPAAGRCQGGVSR